MSMEWLSPPKWLSTRQVSKWPVALIPWFIAAPLELTDRKLPKYNGTGYLNGLRALGCVIVYTCHSSLPWSAWAYGSGMVEQHSHWSLLPIINIIYAGNGSVSLFFVMSGLVLTMSPLRKISSGASADSILQALCSSILRRGLRLLGPLFVIGVMIILFSRIDTKTWPDGAEGTFFEHIYYYWGLILPFFNPFSLNAYGGPRGMAHCWTIPVEYVASLLSLFMCLGVSYVTPWARKLLIVFCTLSAFFWVRPNVGAYFVGMFLAELNVNPISQTREWLAFRRWVPWTPSRSVKTAIAAPVFVASIFFLSWPLYGALEVNPYRYLSHLAFGDSVNQIIGARIMSTWGSIGLLATVEHLPGITWFLETPPIQYMGEISFSFYLLHMPLLYIIGDRIADFCMYSLGMSYTVSMWLRYFITITILLFISDYFWRGIDEKCTRLSHWMAKRVLQPLKDRNNDGLPPTPATPAPPYVPTKAGDNGHAYRLLENTVADEQDAPPYDVEKGLGLRTISHCPSPSPSDSGRSSPVLAVSSSGRSSGHINGLTGR